MPSYAMYLRKSRADIEAEAHGEGETLARHEKLLTDLARQMNLPVTAFFREVVSGDSIDARPEVQRLLSAVEQGEYSGVLVVDADRLARGDTVDQGIVARAFRLSNTKIITPKKIYDPSNEFDEEYFEFELFMARREYKMIARRIQRGRIASVKDGKFIGSTPPYGYDKVKIRDGKGYTLVPNAEAETVKLIYKLYLNGEGMTVIANTLDEMHIIPRNRETWSKSTISDILSNPVYTGKIRWSYRPDLKISLNGKIQTRRVKNDSCYLVDGLHEAIVSTEDFERAQVMRSVNRKPPLKASTELRNPLTGLIYCEKCGTKMTRLGANSRNRYDTLKCPNRYCDCVSSPIFLVEDLLLESLKEWLEKYTVSVSKSDNDRKTDTAAAKEKAIAELTAAAEKLDEQIASTYDLLEQKVYTIEIFTERNKALSERKNALLDDAAKLRQSLIEIKNNERMRADIIPQFREVIELYNDSQTAEQKNALLKSVLKRIDYRKDSPNRKWHLNDVNFTLRLTVNVPEDDF